MSGTTYGRTGGRRYLPGTWAYVRKMAAIPDDEKITPIERFDYDTATDEARAQFNALAMAPATTPPAFLRFAKAESAMHLTRYPGETDASRGFAASGFLTGLSIREACDFLRISPERLLSELTTFHGEVTPTLLPSDTLLYRTVGLTAKAAPYGGVTNLLLGTYWDLRHPNTYRDLAEWRASVAVLAEWNGDLGYVEAKLAMPVAALVGRVGMQKIPRHGNGVLPGGGQQVFVPSLTNAQLATPIAQRPLGEVIRETRFGTDAR